jgi:hypothetical protein
MIDYLIHNVAEVCEEVSKKNNGGTKNLAYAYGMFYGIMKGLPKTKQNMDYLKEQQKHWATFLYTEKKD